MDKSSFGPIGRTVSKILISLILLTIWDVIPAISSQMENSRDYVVLLYIKKHFTIKKTSRCHFIQNLGNCGQVGLLYFYLFNFLGCSEFKTINLELTQKADSNELTYILIHSYFIPRKEVVGVVQGV